MVILAHGRLILYYMGSFTCMILPDGFINKWTRCRIRWAATTDFPVQKSRLCWKPFPTLCGKTCIYCFHSLFCSRSKETLVWLVYTLCIKRDNQCRTEAGVPRDWVFWCSPNHPYLLRKHSQKLPVITEKLLYCQPLLECAWTAVKCSDLHNNISFRLQEASKREKLPSMVPVD